MYSIPKVSCIYRNVLNGKTYNWGSGTPRRRTRRFSVESVEMALKREVREELGITDFIPETVMHYVFESAREKELVFVHKTVYDGEIHPSDELDGGRFWSPDEIKANIGKGVFTPNFEGEIGKVINL